MGHHDMHVKQSVVVMWQAQRQNQRMEGKKILIQKIKSTLSEFVNKKKETWTRTKQGEGREKDQCQRETHTLPNICWTKKEKGMPLDFQMSVVVGLKKNLAHNESSTKPIAHYQSLKLKFNKVLCTIVKNTIRESQLNHSRVTSLLKIERDGFHWIIKCTPL